MKTINGRNAVRVVVASLILSMPGLALASPISSRDITSSDSAMITNSVVAATSNNGSPTGSVVPPPTEKTPCATQQNGTPTASVTDDPIVDDARKGVDGYFTSEN
jgi:hypothetical protein